MTLKVMHDNNLNILAKEDGIHYYTLSGYTNHYISNAYGAKFEVTLNGLMAQLGSGQGAVYGRHLVNDGEAEISCQLPINSQGYLVLSLDLTKSVGSELSFTAKTILDAEDLNYKGAKYDLPLYHYQTNATSVIKFDDVRVYYDRQLSTDRIADQAITVDKLANEVFLKMYPIGSIYTSVVNTSPSTLFGGVWTAFATGRTLVGIDTTQAEFNTIEKAGGAKTHTLTVPEIPGHTHVQRVTTGNTGTALRNDYSSDGRGLIYDQGVETSIAGGGLAHNNLQPYITVYMWKRTA